ncbi:MAG TPA: SAM-dependent methyltransferase [Polyangiaceae bacterium]
MTGFPVRNPESLIARNARVVVRAPNPLQGEVKLGAALAAFRPAVAGRIALDVGASTGGFTRALLKAGAVRVYAVDAGYGQLLGSLRQDRRVVSLERTNLATLDERLIPDEVFLITIDVSYVALALAVPQLSRVRLAHDAELIALVKPMYELGLAELPSSERIPEAIERAHQGVTRAGWRVLGVMESPVLGRGGAFELLLHARQSTVRQIP